MNASTAITALLDSCPLLGRAEPHEVIQEPITAIFTASKQRFAQALLSVYSFKKYHPQANVVFILCDETSDPEVLHSFLPPESHFSQIKDIGIPHFKAAAFQYTLFELCCSAKPFAIDYALKLFPGQPGFYCDGDLLFFSPLHEAIEALHTASIVITPHRPHRDIPHLREKAIESSHYGLYNGGFLGFSDTRATRECLHWWQNAVIRSGFNNPTLYECADQKWLDAVPIFWPSTYILDHPGYNISWWNLDQRAVNARLSLPTAQGLPVRFFHLSAFNRAKGGPLMRGNKLDASFIQNKDFPFADVYREALRDLLKIPGMPVWEEPYLYDYFSNGRFIPFYLRRGLAYAEPWPILEDPFDAKHYWKLRARFLPPFFHICKRLCEKLHFA